MGRTRINWDSPPLDPEDQRLVDAYAAVKCPVDDLPYTKEFEDIRARLQLPDNDQARHELFRRLLGLRKMARLPRLGRLGSSDVVSPPPDASDQRLMEAYLAIDRPLDDLAYTEDFKQLCQAVGTEPDSVTGLGPRLVFRRLMRLRKNGWLPRLSLLKE